jgi:hypothetical protein
MASAFIIPVPDVFNISEQYAHPNMKRYRGVPRPSPMVNSNLLMSLDRQDAAQYNHIPVDVSLITDAFIPRLPAPPALPGARIEAATSRETLCDPTSRYHTLGAIAHLGTRGYLIIDLPELLQQAADAGTILHLAVPADHLNNQGRVRMTSPYFRIAHENPDLPVLSDYAGVRAWLSTLQNIGNSVRYSVSLAMISD